jgi:hypothetical protein
MMTVMMMTKIEDIEKENSILGYVICFFPFTFKAFAKEDKRLSLLLRLTKISACGVCLRT